MTAAAPDDFGSRMKHARVASGVALRDIATRTKISVSALEALERNDISRLPGGIFGRAFVRAYAEEVGLDPEQTIREFLEAFPHDTVTAGSPYVPAEDHTAVESSRRSAETAVKLAAASVAVIIAILYFTLADDRGESQLDLAPAAAPQAAPVPPPPAGPALTPAASGPFTVELHAVAPVSVTLVADGVAEGARTMLSGERRVLAIERGLTLTVSDAAALAVTIDGVPSSPLGLPGEARTVEFDRESLGARPTAR